MHVRGRCSRQQCSNETRREGGGARGPRGLQGGMFNHRGTGGSLGDVLNPTGQLNALLQCWEDQTAR